MSTTRRTALPAKRIGALTLRHTAFYSFRGLINADGGYRPSLRVNDPIDGVDLTELADAYDHAQAARGDPRRAFRS